MENKRIKPIWTTPEEKYWNYEEAMDAFQTLYNTITKNKFKILSLDELANRVGINLHVQTRDRLEYYAKCLVKAGRVSDALRILEVVHSSQSSYFKYDIWSNDGQTPIPITSKEDLRDLFIII